MLELGRRTLLGALAVMASAPAAQAAPEPGPAADKAQVRASINHRTYSGKITNYDPDKKEIGREYFTVTVQPDGFRTLRQILEWDDLQTLKDVTVNLNPDRTPNTAYIQFFNKQNFQGATWYRFDENIAECDGWTVLKGRFHEEFALHGTPANFFYQTAHQDVMGFAELRNEMHGAKHVTRQSFVASQGLLGVSAASLIPVRADLYPKSYVGLESLTLPAGTFKADHFRYTQKETGEVLDEYSLGEDCIPLRIIVRGMYQDLVELSGDYR